MLLEECSNLKIYKEYQHKLFDYDQNLPQVVCKKSLK